MNLKERERLLTRHPPCYCASSLTCMYVLRACYRYVAVSPQRIMAAAHGSHGGKGSTDALTDDELLLPLPDATATTAATSEHESIVTTTLAFTVLGDPGELVDIAVVFPSQPAAAGVALDDVMMGPLPLGGKVRVARVEVGPSGRSDVKCSTTSNGCHGG